MFGTAKEIMYLIEKKEDLYMSIKTVKDIEQTETTVDTILLTVAKYIDLLILKIIQNNPLLNSKAYFLS